MEEQKNNAEIIVEIKQEFEKLKDNIEKLNQPDSQIENEARIE